MYRRYIVVGVVFFLLIGAYFIFFDKKSNDNEYEKYYNKLLNRTEFSSYLNDVNINIEEIEQENSKYTYTITFGGVTEKKENIKILVLDEKCSKENVEVFPSIGIVSDKGYSLVKEGEQDTNNKLYEIGALSIADKEKIDIFLIYFNSNGREEFVKVKVSDFLN